MLPDTIAIPYITCGNFGDTLLKYCLRSYQKYADIKRVILSGDAPQWYTGDHLPVTKDPARTKTYDIFYKVKTVASYLGNGEFIFTNDDHFLLRLITEIPNCHAGSLQGFKGGSAAFMRFVVNTARAYPAGLYFDVHTPIVMEARKMAALQYIPDTILKSCYGNEYGLCGEIYGDCKINQHLRMSEIEKTVAGKWVFSLGDGGISPDMRTFLENKFPEKSRWEI